MMTTDQDRINAIRARAEAARPGPWHHDSELIWPVEPSGPGDPMAGTSYPENAEFIAEARADVPWLLDQLEQARAERDRQRGLRKSAQVSSGQKAVELVEVREKLAASHAERTRLAAERDRARADLAGKTAQFHTALDRITSTEEAEQQAREDRREWEAEATRLRAELATVRATRKHVRAERDRLKTDLTAAEEARQAWVKTVQEQLAEVEAERDQLAAAVQRVCDLPLLNFTSINDPRVAAAARAWSKVVADLADLSALLEGTGGEVPDAG